MLYDDGSPFPGKAFVFVLILKERDSCKNLPQRDGFLFFGNLKFGVAPLLLKNTW